MNKPYIPLEPAVARSNYEDGMDRMIGDILDQVNELHRDVEQKVANGLVIGVKQLLADDEFMAMASQRMTARILTESGKQASQWLGSRILTMLVIAFTGFAIGWLVKTGKLG